MTLSKIDITKILGYIITGLTGLTAATLHTLFPTLDTATQTTILTWLSIIAGILTLIYSTLQKPTPDNLHPVFSTSLQPTAATVTTLGLEKARVTGAPITDPTKPTP